MNSLSKLKQCLDYNEKTPVINLTGVFNKDKFNNIIEGPQLNPEGRARQSVNFVSICGFLN